MSALITGGYVILARKILESGIMEKPSEYLKVFLYLLLKARHEDNCKLKRGQGFISIPELIEKTSYKVGFRIEKLSKKKVWNILEWLRFPYEGDMKETMIVTMKVTNGLVYTISNYELYQNPKNYEGNDEGNDEKPTKVTRGEQLIDKNVKNETRKKEKEITIAQNPKIEISKTQKQEWFNFFWSIYPKKVGKAKAEVSWMKIQLDEILFNEIISGLEKSIQFDTRFRDQQYIPHPTSWLNGKEWENSYQTKSSNSNILMNMEDPNDIR